MSIAEIAERLRHEADALARVLLPGGHYEHGGAEWKCPGSQSPTGEPISVHVGRGPKQGVCGFWTDARRGGDMLDLIEVVRGGDKRDATRYAQEFLGLGDEPHATRLNLRNRHRVAQAPRADGAEGRRRAAENIWNSGERLQGVALSYLRARGIDPDYAEGGGGGNELRFHHGLAYPGAGSFPAIVARVADADDKFLGIWRVYLKPDGSGKAPVENPKLGLGNTKGGAVRIGGVWTEIGVAEGFENALAARQWVHRSTEKLMPVWPALSAQGLAGIVLPAIVARVRIFADHDPVKFRKCDGAVLKSPGLSAAQELATRLIGEGRSAVIEKPPVGLDWTEVINLVTP